MASNQTKFSELIQNETQAAGDFEDRTLKSARRGITESERLAGEMFERANSTFQKMSKDAKTELGQKKSTKDKQKSSKQPVPTSQEDKQIPQ